MSGYLPINDDGHGGPTYTKVQWEIHNLEDRLKHLQLRLKHDTFGLKRRTRLGAQMDACTARILALKLAHA